MSADGSSSRAPEGGDAETGEQAADESAEVEPADASFAGLGGRHEAFFDVEWYALQAGTTFAGRAEALDHATRWMDERGYSPHPLYLVTWGRALSGKTRLPHTESYRLLLTQGWTEQDPHPAVELEHLATNHPESLRDADGVFGWLLKSLAAGARLRTVPGEGRPLDWDEFRRGQLAALAAQQEASARLPRWRALRRTRKFDEHAEQAYVTELLGDLPVLPGTDPLVTVVMPAYNRARAISQAIRSVQAQTMRRWELIVVDDGSLDDTARIARQYAADDARIAVVDQPHRGVSAARNVALAQARGTWIAFLDTDNTWVPRYLEVMTAALASAGALHGHCAQRVEDEDGVSYQALDRTDLLDVGNHIDLNVWMVRREALGSIGTFDETLRRAVDYDLIWRATRASPPVYVPMVGGDYSLGTAAGERITDVESFYWKDVVRSQHVVDWDASAPRTAGVSAVVVWKGEPLRDLVRTLRHIGADTSGVDEVVVVGTGGHRQGTAIVHAERVLSGKITEVSAPPLSHTPLLANIGFAATGRDKVLFLRPGTVVPDDGLADMTAAVDDGAVVAQPVLLDERGVIIHAGFRFLDEDTHSAEPVLPSRFLEDHLAEDLAGLPDRLETDGAALTCMMTGAQDFATVRGFDALYGNFWFDIDYVLRVTRASGRVVVTCSRVQAEGVDRQDFGVPVAMGAAALLLERHGPPAARSASPWEFTPFAVVGLERDDPEIQSNAFLKAPRPVLAVERSRPPGERLRVAIKHCAPPGERGKLWGDVYFARDLANAFVRRGHDVRVDNRESIVRRSARLDEVNIVVRGVRALHPVPGAVNVLWIISHPDRVKREDLVGFDLVYAASNSWAEIAAARFGRPVKPLLQATEPSRFRPRPEEERVGPDVLFVGNRRTEYRRPVGEGMALAAAEFDVGIYGGGWSRGDLGPSVVRGEFLSNDDLPRYYASAEVVMNDHFPTMRDHGIINNRILDALACGTPVLTDEVPGARDVFDDRVLWYEQPSDIPAVLRRYFADPWTQERRAETARWTRENHSFDARVATILSDIAALRDA